MAKLPYFRWYPKDFEVDENVRLMDLDELGLYMKCLNHSWLNDGLPVDEDEVRRLFNLEEERFAKMWRRVGRCFAEANGRLRNSRQEEEREIAAGRSKSNKSAAKMRWQCRQDANAQKTDANASESDANAIPRAYGSGSVSGSDSSEESAERNPVVELPSRPRPVVAACEFDTWVERWYGRHPKKRDKGLVAHAVVRLSRRPEADALFRLIDEVHAEWCESDEWLRENSRYCPKLAAWLDDEGWTRRPQATESPPRGVRDLAGRL